MCASLDRIVAYAESLGCVIEMESKHRKINYRGKTILVIARDKNRNAYDVPAIKRKLKQLIERIE